MLDHTSISMCFAKSSHSNNKSGKGKSRVLKWAMEFVGFLYILATGTGEL